MMSDEDEDGVKQYDKIPDYILEHNMVFMLPDVVDPFGRGYVSIPMPYGMNAFHNVGVTLPRWLRADQIHQRLAHLLCAQPLRYSTAGWH